MKTIKTREELREELRAKLTKKIHGKITKKICVFACNIVEKELAKKGKNTKEEETTFNEQLNIIEELKKKVTQKILTKCATIQDKLYKNTHIDDIELTTLIERISYLIEISINDYFSEYKKIVLCITSNNYSDFYSDGRLMLYGQCESPLRENIINNLKLIN